MDQFTVGGLPFRVVLVRGEPHLLGPNIVHSAGTEYRVFRLGFAHYEVYAWARTHRPLHVLLIGAGLGSALALLWQEGIVPDSIDFVEIEERIVHWAKRLLPPAIVHRTRFVVQDGWQFLQGQLKHAYHLIVLDVCTDEQVPDWVYFPALYRVITGRWLRPGGWLLANLFVHTTAFREKAQRLIHKLREDQLSDFQLDVFELPTQSNWLLRITAKDQHAHE